MFTMYTPLPMFGPDNRPEVFLGGTTAGPDWRESLTTLLDDVRVFNPVVNDWTNEAKEHEARAKEECQVSVYVFTPYIRGVYSVAELVEDMLTRRPGKTVACFLGEFEGRTWTKFMRRSMESLEAMCSSHGCPVCHSLEDTASAIKKLCGR